MISGFVSNLINAYLSEYIEDITDKLSLEILSESCTLKDLKIKSKPINDLKLPFKLIFGKVGRIDVIIRR